MRIDVQDSVAVGKQAAKRAREEVAKAVEAVQAVDLPVESAKSAAKKSARRARAAARKATRHDAAPPARRRVGRRLVIALTAVAVVAVAVAVARRLLAPPAPAPDLRRDDATSGPEFAREADPLEHAR